jgi:hypothetical protein
MPKNRPKTAKKESISMSKESRITALAIMKSMIESGHYRVPDDEFDSTLRGFVSMHERVAGPSEENQGGYRAVSAPTEKVGGTSDLPPLPATYQLMYIEDKGNYVRCQVQTSEGKKWGSAWDKDAGTIRACKPGDRVTLDLNPSKCGKYLNIKNVVKPYHPVQENDDIPF